MSLTKAHLETTIEALHQALQQEIACREALETEVETLHAENTQLATLLLQASAHYQQLYDYITRLEQWASAHGAQKAA